MCDILFFEKNQVITGFILSGHATADQADEEGRLVCAAISSPAYLVANTITDVIGAKAQAEADDGYMRVALDKSDKRCRDILEGFRQHVIELMRQYPSQVKVTTEVL